MHRIILGGVLSFCGLLAAAQSARTIVDEHLADYGQVLWDQMATVSVDGFWIHESFQKHPIKITFKNPNKIRLDGQYQGERFVQASDGVVAWQVVPWAEEVKMTLMPADERMCLTNLYQMGSPLARYADSLVLDGLESVEGELLIKLRYENDQKEHLFYLGREDYRLYAEKIQLKTAPLLVLDKKYEKYKSYRGFLTPTSVIISCEDVIREFAFNEITLGAGASVRLFEWQEGQ